MDLVHGGLHGRVWGAWLDNVIVIVAYFLPCSLSLSAATAAAAQSCTAMGDVSEGVPARGPNPSYMYAHRVAQVAMGLSRTSPARCLPLNGSAAGSGFGLAHSSLVCCSEAGPQQESFPDPSKSISCIFIELAIGCTDNCSILSIITV